MLLDAALYLEKKFCMCVYIYENGKLWRIRKIYVCRKEQRKRNEERTSKRAPGLGIVVKCRKKKKAGLFFNRISSITFYIVKEKFYFAMFCYI